MKKLIFLFLILVVPSFVLRAQQSPVAKYQSNNSQDTCELTTVHTEQLVKAAINNKERIFIISRLGINEPWKLNKMRLTYARKTLETIGQEALSSQNVITAIGERQIKSVGSLEFYLGGEFFQIVFPQKNKQVCLKESFEYLGNMSRE